METGSFNETENIKELVLFAFDFNFIQGGIVNEKSYIIIYMFKYRFS